MVEELLYYKRAGAVEDWVWESVELVILPQLTTPGGLEWWAKRRRRFTSERPPPACAKV